MYKDHIVKPRATDNVAFMGAIAVAIFTLALFTGLGESGLARLMGPIVLDLHAPLLRDIAVAGTLTVTLVLNLFILGRFPLRAQVITVWCELLVLFLLFFDTFNLSYSFIASKVGFMITQGVFTTVYVSTLSIAIAFVLALLGATARLSSNGFAIAIASFYT
ncbi:amino acid ABC transporter permease, partial [Salmonella enterica]|nr:amino acid ABC transporter permease [Salmonella enterica]